MRSTGAAGHTGRDRKSEEVRRRITSTAFRLFLSRGYAETTIREISAESSVSSGSIYHFFGDKEGIFLQLSQQLFQLGLSSAERLLQPGDSLYHHLALRWTGIIHMFSGSERIAEMMLVGYRSRKITDALMPIVCSHHRHLLGARLADWSDERLAATMLLLHGALSSLLDERLQQNHLSEAQRIESLLGTFLPAFGADAAVTRAAIDKARLTLAHKQDMLGELLTCWTQAQDSALPD